MGNTIGFVTIVTLIFALSPALYIAWTLDKTAIMGFLLIGGAPALLAGLIQSGLLLALMHGTTYLSGAYSFKKCAAVGAPLGAVSAALSVFLISLILARGMKMYFGLFMTLGVITGLVVGIVATAAGMYVCFRNGVN